MSKPSEYRSASAVIGCLLLVLVPGTLTGPALFGSVPFAALPGWVVPTCIASGILGAWHFVTAIWALDEDLEFITGYVELREAAVLILPFVLFVGTRSVYRRLFLPAYVAQQRWAKRREQRLQAENRSYVAGAHQDFADTTPLKP